MIHAMARLALALGIWGALLLIAAGTLAWMRAWVHTGLLACTMTVNLVVLLRANPDVVAARMRRQHGGARSEAIMLPLFLLAVPSIPIIAGLDVVRYAWTSLPAWTLWPGLVVHLSGDWFMLWAMSVNPYLEGVVRIQTERGHRVVTTGPYAVVRHPMYLGLIQLLAGIPLFLGSCWAFVPVGIVTVGLVVRAACEDRMLRRGLPDYEAYTRATPYRLIPRVW